MSSSVYAWAEAGCSERMSWNVTNSSGLDADAVPLNHSLLQEDLRIYLSDDTTEKSYWSENSSTAWIANLTDNNGYLYYNCTDSESSGKATFTLFDDFEDDSINTTIWNAFGNTEEFGGQLYITGTGWGTDYIQTDDKFGPAGMRYKLKAQLTNGTNIHGFTGWLDTTNGITTAERLYFSDGDTKGQSYDGGWTTTSLFGINAENTVRNYEIRWVTTSYAAFYIDDSFQASSTTNIADQAEEFSIDVCGDGLVMYWIFLHSDTDAFQSVSFGSEESPAGDTTPPTMTTQNPVNETDETESVIDINITVSEDADWCGYNLDGGVNYTMLNDSMTNWFQVNQSVIANGTTSNLQIYCNDTAGNMGYNGSLWFTYVNHVDVTAPTMTLPNPENVSHTSLPIDINITVSEDADWCGYNLDGGVNTTTDNSSMTNWFSQTNSSLIEDHTYHLYVYCNDTSGNMALNSSVWFTYDTTVPSADFVSPTLGNASYTDSADYIEVNVSSDETLSEGILQIDYINYSMACTGQYCYLNLTNLGDSGIADEPSIWAKYAGNVVIPHAVAEPEGFYLDGTFHLMWREGYIPTGFARANSTTGFPTYTTETGAFLPNATADEAMIAMPYLYYCARPECEHDYYIFYVAKNNSGDTDIARIKVMWSDNLYDTSGNWFRCATDLATIGAASWRSNILANMAPHFNGTGWNMLVEGHSGAMFQIGAFSKDQTDPCVAFDVLNNDLPVMAAGDWSGSEQGTGNPWFRQVGDRYITYTGGKSSGKWKTYSLNSTDFITWTMRDTSPIIDTTSAYDADQTADPVFIIATGQTNDSFIYYGAINNSGNNIAIAAATTNYTVNDIWGAGIQSIGELEFMVYVKDSAGNWNSTSRTLNFGSDTTPPTITINSPTNDTYTTATINLNVTLNENADWCGWNLDGGDNTTMSGSGTVWYSGISPGTDGTYQLFVYCNDTAGNMALNSSLWFTYHIEYEESYNSYTYETAEETFSIIFDLSNYETITNVTAVLNWNGTDYVATSRGQVSNIMTINATVLIPDATADEHTVGFYWNYTLQYVDDSEESATTGTHNQTVYKMEIDNCTSGNITLNFLLKNEETGAAVTGDLDITFTVDSVAGGYDTDKNFSFGIDSKDTFTFCMKPYWTTFYVDSFTQFEASGYSPRTYYLTDAGISNMTQNISLYLMSNTSTTLVTMEVVSALGLPVEGIQIHIQRYYIDTNTYETVTILETNFRGEAAAYLTLNTVWYRFILIQDGEVQEQYSPMVLTENELTFRLTSESPGEWFQYHGDVAHNCTTANNVTTCTVSDTSGLMVTSGLVVKRWTSLGYIDVCDLSATSSSTTHVCSLGATSERIYWYSLTATFASTHTTLESGYLDYTTQDPQYGLIGVLGALFLTVVLVFIGAYRPEISMAMAATALALSYGAGIVAVSYGSVVALFVVTGAAIYKMRSR